MPHKVTKHQFINCYVRTHPFVENKHVLAEIEWISLLQKCRLSHKPQIFYDAARFMMNQWIKEKCLDKPMFPNGVIPQKNKKRKSKQKNPDKNSKQTARKNISNITIKIKSDQNQHTVNRKFTESDTILDIKKSYQAEKQVEVAFINLYHETMDCLFEDEKTLKFYRINGTYTMRHMAVTTKDETTNEATTKREKVKINKETFIQTSETKMIHYAKFPTLSSYGNPAQSDNKASELTKQILSEEPSGDPKETDTLLHILDAAAQMNGKKCVFFDSSKGIKSDLADTSLNVDGNDEESSKFVVTLKNLDQFVDEKEEKKYDKADKLIEIKEALTNKTYNPIIKDIRDKLAAAHGVNAERIIIDDIYLNGVGVAYRVSDLTNGEKNQIITESKQFEGKMRKLFNDYDKCAIHPALLHNSYDIAMFDARGNKTFSDSDKGKYKVGPPGKKREYIQPAGWTRYGLKVLGKYGDDKWLHPFQDAGNWYRAYHGTSREAGSSIFKTKFRSGSHNAYGKGIYCTPDINVAASYCASRGGKIKLQTKKGLKEFYFVFQVAVNPVTMNNPAYIPNFKPSCESVNYWIAPTGADIRPYGILIKAV